MTAKKKLAEVSPATARKGLRTLWSKVAVYSCADGTLRMEPVWRKKYSQPGFMTRMYTARLVEVVLRLPRKSINWEKRCYGDRSRE